MTENLNGMLKIDQLILGVVLIIFLILQGEVLAQDGRFDRVYFTPTVSAGFTFGATFNIGVGLDVTTSITSNPNQIRRTGVSLSHYLVLSKGGFQPHQISNFDLMYENDQLDIKAGYSLMRYSWGRARVNRWGQSAFNFDVSFTNRNANIPWFGVKSVFFNQVEWTWFDMPYFSAYVRQKFPISE